MDTDLDGEVALVTGASSGIGRATADALGRAGATVALAARRADRLRAVADDIEADHGARTVVVPTDVSVPEETDRMVSTVTEACGGLDVLVNNAGVIRTGVATDLSTDAYRAMMGTNVDGAFYASRAALPALRASTGTLVFVGSNAGVYPYPPNPVYAASKWWIRGFAHSLASSVGEEVAVSVVNPSTTRTDLAPPDGESNRERFDPGETLDPADVADAIVYAVGRDHPDVVNELNLFRQDEIGRL